MSLQLFQVNRELLIAQNENMAEEIFRQRYPSYSVHNVKLIESIDGYKIIPVGENIVNVLDQIALSYMLDHSG